MHPFPSTHGKHCTLRTFKSECPSCGADILYWECTHGCKVFFEYPPYGKLIKYRCKKNKGKNIRKKYDIIVKTPKGLLENTSKHCHACGKIFKNQQSLNDHITQMEKCDYFHQILSAKGAEDQKSGKKENKSYKPKFGQINVKRK
jgi:sarcosine oxidase delta subunit